MRTLYARNLYWPEDFGGNRYPFEVTTRLARRGHDVQVVTGRPEGSPRTVDDGRLRLTYFPVRRGHPVLTHSTNVLSSLPVLHRALRQSRPDVAFVSSYDVGLAYSFIPSRPPTAFVYHSRFYSDAVERLRTGAAHRRLAHALVARYIRSVERRVLSSADAIVAVSRFSRDEIVARVPEAAERVRLIPTGVDTEFFAPGESPQVARERLGLARDARVAVVVGRLAPVKRFERALEVVAHLRSHGSLLVLLVIGEGPERTALEAHAREFRIDGAVRFFGYLGAERLRDALRAADVQLCTSEFENLSLSVLEGLSTGVPVAAVPTGGTVELLSAVDPRLLASDSEPAALAATVQGLLSDDAWRREVSNRGRAHIRAEHDWERVIDRLESLAGELARHP